MKTKKKLRKLKVGDNLYRHVTMSGIWEYEVFGVHQYENSVQYAVRCNTCTHGWKCELLIAENDYSEYAYISMLNNSEHDDQRHWHNGDNKFCITRKEAHRQCYEKMLKKRKEEIRKSEETTTRLKKNLEEIEEALESAKNM